jgi:predicted nucleic acid-binding Zn ribbon protein
MNIFQTLLFVSLAVQSSIACKELLLTSGHLGQRIFAALGVNESIAAGLVSGHATYKTSDDGPVLFLYHTAFSDGRGRWVVNTELGALHSAVAYIDSWAVMPTLTHALSNTREQFWQRFEEPDQQEQDGDTAATSASSSSSSRASSVSSGAMSKWVDDPLTFFQCHGANFDSTLFIDIVGVASKHSGFFVQRADSHESSSAVYSHIGLDGEPRKYLFKKGEVWVIGEEVDSSHGLAYRYMQVSEWIMCVYV